MLRKKDFNLKLIDTHAHLYAEQYKDEIGRIIEQFDTYNIDKVLNVGIDIESCKKVVEMIDKYPKVYGGAGFHPTELAGIDLADLAMVRELLNHPKILAVGEVGLDYYWDNIARDKQKKIFIKQLEISLEEDYPVVIHCRNADDDMLEIIKSVNPQYKGVFHCYAGDLKMAEELLKRGFYISFTGVITFKNSDRAEVIKEIPLNRILLETDSPYLTPVPFRGKRNDPTKLIHIAEKIIEIKDIPKKEALEAFYQNSIDLFEF